MTPSPTSGDQFGGYRLGDQLGRGGMGVVFRAEHMHLGRTVALKVLIPELSGNADFRDRFLRESRLAATLDHPNVVTVYDAGEFDGALFLAMRLVRGQDLSTVLAAAGPMQPDEALDRIGQVADALDAAHAAGLVHRDVKPANVLVEGPRCYLTDFGLTKRTHSPGSVAVTAMTATGIFLGTPDYAAPEQISGQAVDARTDVYALGGMLHECLTGARPFPRDSQVAVLYAQLHEDPPRPSEIRPGLPPEFDGVIAKALAKRPSERYASCGELMRAARAAFAGSPTAVRAPSTVAGGGPAPTPAPLDDRSTGTHSVPPPAPPPSTPPTPVAAAGPPPPSYRTVRAGRNRKPLVLAGIVAAVVAAVLAVVLLAGGGSDSSSDGGDGGGGGGDGAASGEPRVAGSPLPVGSRPFGVAVGEGVLWVANNDDDTVTRITPDGRSRTDINVGDGPFGVTRAGGSVWVANSKDGTVVRIDVATGRASDPIPVGESPYFLAADESSVFVANGGDGTVSVLDARTGKPAGDPIEVGGEPRGIVSSGTAVWVADRAADSVKRIVNGRVVREIPVGKNPVQVAFGQNALWVTNKDSGTVSRIDLAGSGTDVKTIRVGSEPFGIAFGAGHAWVTVSGDNTVVRLDPETGEPVGDPIPVPDQPVGIAVGGGEVWVTSNDDDSLTRILPE